MSLTTTRDWGISAGLEYTLGNEKVAYMKASLKASYGEGFEKTTSQVTLTNLASWETTDVVGTATIPEGTRLLEAYY